MTENPNPNNPNTSSDAQSQSQNEKQNPLVRVLSAIKAPFGKKS